MLINALDDELHARMKKTMEGGFTEKAVAKQEGIVRGYVDLLIERLRENVRTAGPEDAGEAIVDIVKWLSFTTVDIVGDLAFGESFGCLETGEMSEWVGLACGSSKYDQRLRLMSCCKVIARCYLGGVLHTSQQDTKLVSPLLPCTYFRELR